jgi:hypothetical protein
MTIQMSQFDSEFYTIATLKMKAEAYRSYHDLYIEGALYRGTKLCQLVIEI